MPRAVDEFINSLSVDPSGVRTVPLQAVPTIDIHPASFDPPRFPCRPGKMPADLRAIWRLWLELWADITDPLGLELTVEVFGELLAYHRALMRRGVEFDPEFNAALTMAVNVAVSTGADPDDEGDETWAFD